jgi:hypothetical protein
MTAGRSAPPILGTLKKTVISSYSGSSWAEIRSGKSRKTNIKTAKYLMTIPCRFHLKAGTVQALFLAIWFDSYIDFTRVNNNYTSD